MLVEPDIRKVDDSSSDYSDEDEDEDAFDYADDAHLSDEISESRELMDTIAEAEKLCEETDSGITRDEIWHLDALTEAAIALVTEDQIRLQSTADPTEEEEEEMLVEDSRHLREVRVQMKELSLPHINREEDTNPHFGVDSVDHDDFSLETLVLQREAHQTDHAAKSVRTYHATSPSGSTNAFHDSLKQLQSRGITTGKGRDKRWTAPSLPAPGGRSDEDQPLDAGTSSNAAEVAKAAALKKDESQISHWFIWLRVYKYGHHAQSG
ncbi:hypothetical protein BDZ89DRAFT_1132664 [Hymenopellis radicata]|nr:hypothetical protein BDZ89DRAFT_1132664 [Hymenopellis radicata]